MVKALREEICNVSMHFGDENTEDICKRYMNEKGFFYYDRPNIYIPVCNYYGNHEKPYDQRVRNKVNYYKMYQDGLISVEEAYVIEDEIFDECRKNRELKKWGRFIDEHLKKKPRTQIDNATIPICYVIDIFMEEKGYGYDCLGTQIFSPLKTISME